MKVLTRRWTFRTGFLYALLIVIACGVVGCGNPGIKIISHTTKGTVKAELFDKEISGNLSDYLEDSNPRKISKNKISKMHEELAESADESLVTKGGVVMEVLTVRVDGERTTEYLVPLSPNDKEPRTVHLKPQETNYKMNLRAYDEENYKVKEESEFPALITVEINTEEWEKNDWKLFDYAKNDWVSQLNKTEYENSDDEQASKYIRLTLQTPCYLECTEYENLNLFNRMHIDTAKATFYTITPTEVQEGQPIAFSHTVDELSYFVFKEATTEIFFEKDDGTPIKEDDGFAIHMAYLRNLGDLVYKKLDLQYADDIENTPPKYVIGAKEFQDYIDDQREYDTESEDGTPFRGPTLKDNELVVYFEPLPSAGGGSVVLTAGETRTIVLDTPSKQKTFNAGMSKHCEANVYIVDKNSGKKTILIGKFDEDGNFTQDSENIGKLKPGDTLRVSPVSSECCCEFVDQEYKGKDIHFMDKEP